VLTSGSVRTLHFNKSIFYQKENDLVNFYDNNQFVAIDTVSIDDHSRFIFTKKLKKIFPVQLQDTIAFYQNNHNNRIMLKIQRGANVVGTWICHNIQDISEPFTSQNNFLGHQIHTLENQQEKESLNNIKSLPCLQQQEHNIPSIMIVDDQEDILFTFKSSLKKFLNPINVETFKSFEEALIRFTESHYDLVILDIRLPRINGIQLYKIMKSIRPHVKALFVSALDSAEEFITVLPGIRSSNVLKKPVEMKCFIENLNNLLIKS
jgi:CheY-like chemotaxis protein